jgi:hypothetical protein
MSIFLCLGMEMGKLMNTHLSDVVNTGRGPNKGCWAGGDTLTNNYKNGNY